MWRYISDDWLSQIPKESEISSSTMPQKINPRHFENSEGNAKMSSAICNILADELQRSRLQRDLSGSTLQRWYGAAIATSLQSVMRAAKGLSKVLPNEVEMSKALENHPEVIMEAVQTIGRDEGIQDIYDRSKEFSRGKKLSLDDIKSFVRKLPLSQKRKRRLLRLKPSGYVGEALKIANISIRESRELMKDVENKINYYNSHILS